MRITITPDVLADFFRDGNELHVRIKSPITSDHKLVDTALTPDGNIELVFEDYALAADTVMIESLPYRRDGE